MLSSRSRGVAALLGALAAGTSASCWYDNQPAASTSAGGAGGAAGGAGGAATGGAGGGPALPTGLTANTQSTRFVTADEMLAAIEMQLSGEPFAELLGRSLGGYDRFSPTPDRYTDPTTGLVVPDALGFSLAVESYEYSKQVMNNVSFEAGAGLSLQYGWVLNPAGQTGDAAFGVLSDRLQYFAKASRASGAKIGKDFVAVPPPTGDPTNFYGWPGFWPVFAEFRSFDPAIAPSLGADHACSLDGAIDEPLPPGAVQTFVGDYECDTNTLNLTDREAQVEKVLEPEALALSAWKQALWTINYWGVLHDVDQHAIVAVPEASLGLVGVPGNAVVGQWVSPLDDTKLLFGKDGTFLGDVSLEGWQGLVMLEEMDNKSALLLGGLTTADGVALGGVASVAAAVDYDYQAPLRWWPAAVAVTEATTAPTPAEARKYFPAPTKLAVQSAGSRLADLAALAGGFGEVFALTDGRNAEIGGSQAFRATFDGAPFAADDGVADGEDTLHDRALGIVKMALVNLDRLHFDEAHAVLVDTATPTGAAVQRGAQVSTARTAYSIVELRTALRALDASLTLYSNDLPDTHGLPSALDLAKLDGTKGGSLVERTRFLLAAQADFLADHLLDDGGLAADGYDLAAGARDPAPPSLEAQASAVRGLLEAYLATSDERYRQRAMAGYAALEKHFWMADAGVYRTTAGESNTMTYTPRAFASLHGALRQYYKLVASRPGREAEAQTVLARIVRGMKLVVNGWNDENGDGLVQPAECLGGRLQMAERALTGEMSMAVDQGDRDHDCVPDISAAGLPAALAAVVVFERK
jgi:hypothetical protein